LIEIDRKDRFLGRLSQGISLASINQKGIPSLEDDRTTFTKSLEALNNNSNFSKTSATLVCNSSIASKKSREYLIILIKLNIKNLLMNSEKGQNALGTS
jgi:hypothetical protein